MTSQTAMRAAVLRRPGAALDVLSGITWEPLRLGQILVRLSYSGICHSQVMEARGRRGPDPYLPHLLGHEGSGTVLDVGPGVTKVSPGDRVVLGWIKGEGLEAGGTRYHLGNEIINAGAVTTFNEIAVVSENRVVPLPDGLPMDVAVLFGCALPTGAGIVLNDLRPVEGSTVAIFGLGGIGMSALMATLLCDCAKVVAVDVSEDKLALARAFGATHAIDAVKEDVSRALEELTDGRGVDYAVEATGNARVIERAFSSVRRNGGLCVFASHPRHGDRISLDPYDLICGRQIRGSWGGGCSPDRDVPRFAELYRQGRLPLERLLSRPYKLEAVNEALDDLEAGRTGRPLIAFPP